jgi:hypothetical protein
VNLIAVFAHAFEARRGRAFFCGNAGD